MTEPTDAEIESAWIEATGSSILPYPDDMLAFARAVLAKWGTPPAVAGEPVMWAYQYSDGSWHDASATEHSAGMKPLYPAPQPTQAQAGAVPLTDEKIFDCVNAVLPGKGHRVISETDPEYANEVGIEPGARWIVSEVHPEHSIAFARAIESEVRKHDEALIRQLVGALEDFDDAGPIGEGWKSAPLLSLLASARARLEGKA